MGNLGRAVARGAVAGAVGTLALDSVTYLDMAVRGRPASSTPEQTVERLAEALGTDVPGDEQTRSNRLAGLGQLFGAATGVAVGALSGPVIDRWRLPLPLATAVLGGTAMILTNGVMTALGVTDPRTWSASAWAADVAPHLAYGAVVAAVLEHCSDGSRGRDRG